MSRTGRTPIHGHSLRNGRKTRTYSSWTCMKYRCLNKNNTAYSWYGGRGIKVCKRWLGENGFLNFLADMGECPEGFTLERNKVNKNYSPSNCRWATRKEQAQNRRPRRFGIAFGRWVYGV